MRVAIALLSSALLVAAVAAGRPAVAVDPLEIDGILPLTGSAAFIGKSDFAALQAFENDLNGRGGIDGRPIKFSITDDQSNPQVAVQLTNDLIAKKVAVIVGSSLSSTCAAMMPIVKSGPVTFCLSNAINPVPNGFTFAALVSTRDHLVSGLRYARMRGWRKIALIVSSDSTGQNGERFIDDILTDPVNKDLTIVDREHFTATDLSVAAQVARMKAARPDVVVLWTTGTPAGTVLRGLADAGLSDVPVLISPGNANFSQLEQYASFVPKNLLFTLPVAMLPERVTDPATKAAIAACERAIAPLGIRLDLPVASTWDAGLILVSALRKLGASADAESIRAYVNGLTGFGGIAGKYDFVAIPMRGIGESSEFVGRWDPLKKTFVSVSRAGGVPL